MKRLSWLLLPSPLFRREKSARRLVVQSSAFLPCCKDINWQSVGIGMAAASHTRRVVFLRFAFFFFSLKYGFNEKKTFIRTTLESRERERESRYWVPLKWPEKSWLVMRGAVAEVLRHGGSYMFNNFWKPPGDEEKYIWRHVENI